MEPPCARGRLPPAASGRSRNEEREEAVSESILGSSEVRTAALEERLGALEREVESMREEIRALAADLRGASAPLDR